MPHVPTRAGDVFYEDLLAFISGQPAERAGAGRGER